MLPEWPRDDLAQRVGRALDAAEAAVGLLLDREPELDLNQLETSPDKVVAETAFLLRAVSSIPETVAPTVTDRVPQLVQQLIPHARGDRVRAAIALRPALARDFAVAHVSLSAAGWPDPSLDRLLARSLADPASAGRERQPHRELEQIWIDRLRGENAPTAETLARTALGTGIDLLAGNRDDVYALTHSIIYATDFGASTSLPRQAAEVVCEVRSALAGALDDDDFDLAGELLLTWPLLGSSWDAISSFAFAVLCRIEDEVGVLPSLAIDGEGYRQQPAGARREYFAATTYHTAYVMGLLCASILRSTRRPTTARHDSAASAELVGSLISELGRDDHRTEWEGDLELLPLDQCRSLAPLLLDVAVRRAVRRLDLEAVRRTLAAGLQGRIPSTPVAVQAARLLKRLAEEHAPSQIAGQQV